LAGTSRGPLLLISPAKFKIERDPDILVPALATADCTDPITVEGLVADTPPAVGEDGLELEQEITMELKMRKVIIKISDRFIKNYLPDKI
jgi:hypothetical protein